MLISFPQDLQDRFKKYEQKFEVRGPYQGACLNFKDNVSQGFFILFDETGYYTKVFAANEVIIWGSHLRYINIDEIKWNDEQELFQKIHKFLDEIELKHKIAMNELEKKLLDDEFQKSS